jgi:hypothetical protein
MAGDAMGLEALTDSVDSLITWSKVVELNAIKIRPVRLLRSLGQSLHGGCHIPGNQGLATTG